MSRRTVEYTLSTPGLNAQGEVEQIPLGILKDTQEYKIPGEFDEGFGSEHMLINIGPQHPATHGVLRLVIELDGETVIRNPAHRLSPLGFREAGRVSPVQSDHSLDRPRGLPQLAGQQRRLCVRR